MKNVIISALCSKCERNLMEVELKYAVPDERTADMIWLDDELGAMTEEGSCRASRFYGVYYDTCDHILTRNDITFRIRHEGERTAACLKWNGSGKGALHKRGELDRTIEGDIPETADPEVFGESEIGKKVIKLTEGRALCPMMKVDVLRKSVRVDTGDSLVELSIDRGKIAAGSSTAPVSEVEIELFQGTEEDLLEMGKWLSEKYGLEPESRSKFARGLALIRNNSEPDSK